jgi:hypothetical protein
MGPLNPLGAGLDFERLASSQWFSSPSAPWLGSPPSRRAFVCSRRALSAHPRSLREGLLLAVLAHVGAAIDAVDAVGGSVTMKYATVAVTAARTDLKGPSAAWTWSKARVAVRCTTALANFHSWSGRHGGERGCELLQMIDA